MSLSSTPLIRDIAIEKIDDRIEEHAGVIIESGAADWADYRFRCGVIAGLEEAKQFLEAATKLVVG